MVNTSYMQEDTRYLQARQLEYINETDIQAPCIIKYKFKGSVIYRSLGKIRREKIFVGRHVRRKLNT